MAMKPLTLETIARVTGGAYFGDETLKSTRITGVVRDNRDVFEGCLFVCIRGARADGHSFAGKAFDAGASCCLCQRELPEARGPYVLVGSTLEALKALGEYYRSLFDIPVVGVTGSVGKTTAKEMVAAVLSARYSVLKTPENLNNELGVPLTLLSLREEHEAAVIEMGISEFGEMRRLAKMVRPDIVLMTAIGYCHLEQLGDLRGVLRAKSEVFEYVKPEGLAVVNGDDALLAAFEPGVRKITFGLGEGNDFRAVNVAAYGTEGVSCDIISGGIAAENSPGAAGTLPVFVPAFGSHMVLGALPAAAIGTELGLTGEEIRQGLLSYAPVGGRASISDTGYLTVIDDCYNANPNSMAASVRSLAALPGRRVAILGDMAELGRETDELHRALGVLVAQSGIDVLICCGAKAEFIYKGLVSAGLEREAWHFPLKDALFAVLPKLVRAGDSVLVKASHSMRFEEIVEELRKIK